MQIQQFTFRLPRFMAALCLLTNLLVGSVHSALGQCEPIEPPSLFCEDAPLLCLNQFCYHSQDIPFFCCTGWCGPNTAIHNPQFFQFVAATSDIAIEIHVDGCDGGNGLQSAILDACPWDNSNVIACDPGTPPGGTMILEANDLLPGLPYWIVIDGSAGATCYYTFTSVQGIVGYDLIGEAGPLTANPAILPLEFDTIHFTLTSSISNSQGYYWTFSWHPDTITTSGPELDIFTPCFEEPGIYTVCVKAYSGCDTLETAVCTTFELLPATDRIKPSVIVCPESFPFTWQGMLISGAGTYIKTFYPTFFPGQCPYDSIWTVEAYPDFPDGNIDTIVCANHLLYEGIEYTQSGTYTLAYPGQGINGCDSVALLNLSLHAIDMFVENRCIDSISVLVPHSTLPLSPSDSIIFTWFPCAFDSLLSSESIYIPDSAGCYCLIAQNGFCIDTICSSYLTNPCQTDCSLTRDTSCAGESILFYYGGEASADAKYHWLIDLPGAPGTYIAGHRSMVYTYTDSGWYHVTVTVKDSLSTLTCSDSFYIRGFTSEASICCDGTGCGTCRDLTINLSGAAPWTLYITGTFHHSDTIYNVTSSPYVYTTCPPPDTLSVYFLSVTDSLNQCNANITVNQPVFVVQHPEADASMTVFEETLCGKYVEDASYMWFTCYDNEFLSTELCFRPDTSGCYCLEVTNLSGCSDTTCFEFLISSVHTPEDKGIRLYPNPSTGTWEVDFNADINLPVNWTLVDIWGAVIETGKVEQSNSMIRLTHSPVAGIYFLKCKSATLQGMTVKVLIGSD